MRDFFQRLATFAEGDQDIRCHKPTSQRREMERRANRPAIVAFINLRPQLQSITTLISIREN